MTKKRLIPKLHGLLPALLVCACNSDRVGAIQTTVAGINGFLRAPSKIKA
jgi:hypothetical protein